MNSFAKKGSALAACALLVSVFPDAAEVLPPRVKTPSVSA